jgi:capsid portal protein
MDKEAAYTFIVGGDVVESHPRDDLKILTRSALTDQEKQDQSIYPDYDGIIAWHVTPQTAIDVWYQSSTVNAVGNLIADSMKMADFDLKASEDAENPSEEQKKKVTKWLSSLNFGREGVTSLTIQELASADVKYRQQTGNSFYEVIRNKAGTQPVTLSLFMSQYVYIAKNPKRQSFTLVESPAIGSYKLKEYVPFGSRGRTSRAHEFIHLREPNGLSSVYGVPPWIGVYESIQLDNAHRKYLNTFMSSSATPRWLVEITQDPAFVGAFQLPDIAQVTQLRTTVSNYLRGNSEADARKHLVVSYPGGILIKITPLDSKSDDPTYATIAKLARDEILMNFHVSPMNLGSTDGGYRATAEEQTANFERTVLIPAIKPFISMVDRIISTPEPSGLGCPDWRISVNFRDVATIQRQIQAIVTATGRPILSQNEGREMIGYARSKDEGADELMSETTPQAQGGAGFKSLPDQKPRETPRDMENRD